MYLQKWIPSWRCDAGVDWTRILQKAGIPEPPGYERTQQLMRQRRAELANEQRRATQELMRQSISRPTKAGTKRRSRR